MSRRMLLVIFSISAIFGFLSEAKSGTIPVMMEDGRWKKEEEMSDERKHSLKYTL